MVESLLIKNAVIMTMDPARRVLENGFIRINGDKISDIGSMTKLGKLNSDKVIDAKWMSENDESDRRGIPK